VAAGTIAGAGLESAWGLDPSADGVARTWNQVKQGRLVGHLHFLREGTPEMNAPLGEGLNGRLYTDLAPLAPDTMVTPTEHFYIRTRQPDGLRADGPWNIALGASGRVSAADLARERKPQGAHVMECSGNGAFAHWGMLSNATWEGVSMPEVLARMTPDPKATRVLVSGLDTYKEKPPNSEFGASWIFTREQLAQAFLATHMNGAPLTADHGAPVRLLVPNWYGCTCIKWVNEIRWVADDAPPTSQMLEFAGRTHQPLPVPTLARDFRPAAIDQAAMPLRVEHWDVGGKPTYRVVGVSWGGTQTTDKLIVRFHPKLPFVPVQEVAPRAPGQEWSLWSHLWRPTQAATYAIQLYVNDKAVPARRLQRGHYTRFVQVELV
jgi:DMSO/TMAO reductase YedYZ molybdopterin-dependent catalytic subunit